MAGTFVDVPTNSQHSGTGVSNLLIMGCDSLTQKVSCFFNVLLPTAPAFHHINNVFNFACHIFMYFEVHFAIKLELIFFLGGECRGHSLV